ncbi:MAG: hypothetical protein V4633_10745 [Pseudomonadota bacterium]
MNRSMKAALLSGLVFPGAGQLYLGLRWRGLLFMLPAAAAATHFLYTAWDLSQLILAELRSGRMVPDPLTIAMRLEQQGQQVSPLVSVAALVMIVCWIASTIDAWYLGRQPA